MTSNDTLFSFADLRMAFMAGFEASGEGWNGEYPFDSDLVQIDNALDGAFNEWAEKLRKEVARRV